MIDPKSYPKSFFVGGEEYKIRFAKIQHCGDTNSESKLIRIRRGMSDRETFATLLHELVHAFDFEYRLGLKHKLVYRLERALLAFMLDNYLIKRPGKQRKPTHPPVPGRRSSQEA